MPKRTPSSHEPERAHSRTLSAGSTSTVARNDVISHPLEQEPPSFASAVQLPHNAAENTRQFVRRVRGSSLGDDEWDDGGRRGQQTGTHSRTPSSAASADGWASPDELRVTNGSKGRVRGGAEPSGWVGDDWDLDQPERDVLVHQVQGSDSLAGIALKHGVSLAELRKTNKLWASDSIHLRKELYIPINHRRWEHVKALANSRSATLAENGGASIPPGVELTDEPSKHQDLPVRRIPLSHLSFFPPPTHKSSPPSRNSEIPPLGHEHPAAPGGVLTSFLTSLPDTLARLSSESLNTISSTISPAAHFHGVEGVELAVVKGKTGSLGRSSVKTQQPIPVPQMAIRRPGAEAAREVSDPPP
ncbi:carbohydrate-binding module family 50 protein [Botryobasidium botryosum FD-172 SS1]|uniref:Carbohydrate-binding module family 50 protein n=1 Tax=Botryobasidium botryosum (strain FD-172 SS1) TaxID=930990 RepID=A0A067LVH2_BOTB1|nr:carbohydrate-binding module family 50 protein [Botryobasidium botryosum FD-172 SS1]